MSPIDIIASITIMLVFCVVVLYLATYYRDDDGGFP